MHNLLREVLETQNSQRVEMIERVGRSYHRIHNSLIDGHKCPLVGLDRGTPRTSTGRTSSVDLKTSSRVEMVLRPRTNDISV